MNRVHHLRFWPSELTVLLLMTVLLLPLGGCGKSNSVPPPPTAKHTAPSPASNAKSAPVEPGQASAMKLGHGPDQESTALAQLAAFFLQTKMKQTVSLTAMPVNEGIAQLAVGSLDVFIGVRLPAVDAATLKQHESKIQDLGAVFRGFGAGLLVPVSAAPVTIADLAGQESAFQNKLVLINGGEDVEAAVRSALTAYGLNFTVETLPEAEAVAQAKQAIAGKTAMLLASSLPRWELSRLRLRTLDDPKLALGELQRLHVFSRAKFQRDMKDAAGFMRRFKLLDRQLVTLIDDINKNSADPAAGAALWCEQHPKLVEQWLPREMKIQLGLIDPEKEPGNSGAARGDKPGAPADTGEAGK